MGEQIGSRHGWQRRAIIASAIFALLIVVLHRPLLLVIARSVAIHYANKEHLQLALTLHGTVFTNLTATNIHAVSTGPSDVESIDVKLIRLDYNLFDLIRGRKVDVLRNVELYSGRIVLTPSHPRPPHPVRPNRHVTLPSIIPNRLQVSDLSVIVHDRPRDFVVEHLDLGLDPHTPGELHIARLQLSNGEFWSNLEGITSYVGRNLIVRELKLNDQDRIRLLNVDASHIATKQLAINFEAGMGPGIISNTITLEEKGSSINAQLRLEMKNVAAEALNKYTALPKEYLGGQIEELLLQGTGAVESPRSWTGAATATINDFHVGGIHFDRWVFQSSAGNGVAALRSADAIEGSSAIHLHGLLTLPDKLGGFRRASANIELTSENIDLHQLTSRMARPFSGVAQANGTIEAKEGKLKAAVSLNATSVKSGDDTIEKVAVDLSASKNIPPANSGKSWFAGLRSRLNVTVSGLQLGDYIIDSVTGVVTSVDDLVQIDRLELRRKQNNLTVAGQYRLPADFAETSRTGQVQFSVAAPELGDFWNSDSPDKWSGALQGEGQVFWTDGIGNGEVSFSSNDIRTRGLELKQLNAQCSIAHNVVYLNDFRSNLSEQDFIRADGIVDLWGTHHYTAKISANIGDLSQLQPLLRSFGNQNTLAGSLMVDWTGSGDAIRFKNSGQLRLTLENAHYGNLRSLQANVDATYSPDSLDIPTIFLQSDQMDFHAIVRSNGETLEVTKIQLDQGQAKYASGYISIPFIWKNLGTNAAIIPGGGKVTANFQSENLDIKKLFEDFGAKPLASGILSVKLDARGTASHPDAEFDLEIRDLRSEQLPKFEPATFHLAAQCADGRLSVSGKLQQAKIQPVELTAQFPLDLPRVVQEGKIADQTPLKANLKMPRSSVNFLRQFIPAVQEVDGDVALDVDVSGTFARPMFKGRADMTVNVARTIDPTVPALQNFKARLIFANETLTLDQFGGELSGGHFSATGRIVVPKLTSASVDLAFKAESALVARNDTTAIRTDADIRLQGPITSVNVTGNVALTNSHILKNLDLIPISLPGRPPPQAPASHPQLVLPPQFRDWKFDLAIKTKDPVSIRGNLATGGAVVDLRFVGTGAHPGLDGLVRLENVEATLPFSRLQIGYGFLYFKPDDSLNPKIDLHGTSVIQDYTVHVYIYGTALAPEAIFNSEPPLPQEDLISLLSTGTTREQLTGNNNVLAGRAAMLLVQQVYRKVFKKGQATQTNSVFDRFDLDVGTVDPRTGQQQATARFKINNQFVVVGDLGVSGDYKGMIKYLIRFH